MGLPIIGEAKALVRIHPFLRGLPTVSFHRMRRLMSALCPTTALTMEPPSVQSPFAQFRRYRCWGVVYRLLGGHYSSVFAPTDSCANPSDSPLLRLLASFEESSQVATSPCCQRDLPDVISASPSQDAWAPTTTVCRLHLPVASPAASAFPKRV